jgi:predicted enzyme related to lactoylglutathione lyase
MEEAISWYASLLGLDPGAPSHEGTIFDIPTDGETWLALDAQPAGLRSLGTARLFLWTQDMESTVQHLDALGAVITSDVEDIGSVSFVQFEDPDGNPLMVCRRN